jgi:iron complex transport system ATP-binding protein
MPYGVMGIKSVSPGPIAVIQMQDVSWISGNRYILRDINWTVRKGENWAIIGLNGSGKTSLLNLITGYNWPSRGEISVLEKCFGDYDIRELRKRIGLVSSFLQEKLYATETAEEIVLSGKFATIGLYEKADKTDSEQALRLLRNLQCGYAAKQPYFTLSQGEKQKVLIARALINSPKVLILDEPCAGLDIFSREHLLSSIEKIGKRKSAPTLLYVTHRIEEILPVFTHAILIRHGRIHSKGKTDEILTGKNLRDFLGKYVEVHKRKDRILVTV